MKRLVGLAVCLLAGLAVLGVGGAPILIAARATPYVATGQGTGAPPAARALAGPLGSSAARPVPVVLKSVAAAPSSRPAPVDDGDMDPVSGLALIGANLVALALVLRFVRRHEV